VIFGATSASADDDGGVRDADHMTNLGRVASLVRAAPTELERIAGRTAWRSAAADRLPVVGAVPALQLLRDGDAGGVADPLGRRGFRLEQPRFVPREPGLFVCGALGSRGITWSALCAEVLAATITGSPLPLEADLVDAIDPARFVSRAQRRPLPR
jgi:tRNA 5-methylaminomethyl-2-thiouridine biosynthesis bifunctional protein